MGLVGFRLVWGGLEAGLEFVLGGRRVSLVWIVVSVGCLSADLGVGFGLVKGWFSAGAAWVQGYFGVGLVWFKLGLGLVQGKALA